ncbi:MAG: hypothetical protein HAW63_02330 [Bdellovibrionaceae bacterium]|nr:hypothetical protein [Pseudobdellovibrionaceae bacterium]
MKNFFVLLLVLSFGRLAVAGVDISGEYRFREWNNLTNSSGRSDDSRFTLGASFREGDSLMAHLSLIANSSGLVEASEAYGVWNFADAFELKFGNFSMDWANGTVFASNSWEAAPTVFNNSVSLAYDAGMIKVTYAELDRTEGNALTTAVGVDFMSLPAVAKTVHLFYVKQDTLSKYGAVVAGNVDILSYDLTYASDKDGKRKASMMHAKVGVDVAGMGKVVGTYHKDKDGYSPLSYDKHANAGLMDQYQWGDVDGLAYYTVGYVHSLNDASAAGVFYNAFKNANGDKLGTEIDVYASHKYNDVLVATARYGKHTPEDGKAFNQWMVGLTLNF